MFCAKNPTSSICQTSELPTRSEVVSQTMSSKKRKQVDFSDDEQQPLLKKRKLNTDENDEHDENDEDDDESISPDLSNTFLNLMYYNDVSELLDPLCGGPTPTDDNLDTLNEMESYLSTILSEIRRRRQYIDKQKTIKRNNMLDSFISIPEHNIHSSMEQDWEYPDDERGSYQCEIKIGGETIDFDADWYCGGWEVSGYIQVDGIFKYGGDPDYVDRKKKMYYYDIENAVKFKKNCCKNNNILATYNNDICDFDWIVDILSLGLEVLCRIDPKNWMVRIFGPDEYIKEELSCWKQKCLNERSERNEILNHWIRINKVLDVPDVIDNLIKCFCCTNYGVCCGVLKENNNVSGLDFIS